jgi:hypothetical protein
MENGGVSINSRTTRCFDRLVIPACNICPCNLEALCVWLEVGCICERTAGKEYFFSCGALHFPFVPPSASKARTYVRYCTMIRSYEHSSTAQQYSL